MQTYVPQVLAQGVNRVILLTGAVAPIVAKKITVTVILDARDLVQRVQGDLQRLAISGRATARRRTDRQMRSSISRLRSEPEQEQVRQRPAQ